MKWVPAFAGKVGGGGAGVNDPAPPTWSLPGLLYSPVMTWAKGCGTERDNLNRNNNRPEACLPIVTLENTSHIYIQLFDLLLLGNPQ